MKSLIACALFAVAAANSELQAQGISANSLAAPAKATRRAAKGEPARPAALKKEDTDDAVKNLAGDTSLPPGQQIVTEIYADEAFFDSAKHIGIFTGHVIVNDPRFNVQSDKLTIYLSKTNGADEGEQPANGKGAPGPRQALEKAVAEGNVGVVREKPGENGGPPVRSVGRAEMAIYTPENGNVELRGTPRVQSGLNTHVATSPDTVMVLENGGQLITKGPSRTEIRQQPKAGEAVPAAAPPAKP